MKFEDPNIKVFNDFNFCYKYLEQEELNGNLLGDKFIIGGGQLYNHIHSNYLYMINKVYETVVTYNIIKSEHTHYTNLIDTKYMYPELDFRMEIYNEFQLMNKKYKDSDKVTVICNGDTLHGVTYNVYQNIKYINEQEKQYLDLMKHVMDNGTVKTDRTGTGTKSVFGYQMRFDLAKGFPCVTTKKLHLKSIIIELLWFLKGETNIKYLNENGVKIWDEWADKNGDLGHVYGYQWRSWPTPDGKHIDQIQKVIEQLKETPNSRRIIVSAWNVSEIESMALPPCHTFFQFYDIIL
jgi:hypothetical protein